MAAIRDLIRRYPVAAIAVVVAAAAFGGWTIYQSQLAQRPAAQAPLAPVAPPRPAAAPPVATPTSPSGAAPSVTPTSPSANATPPETSGEGRPNPFEPLTPPAGSAPSGGGTLPPVPPLPPVGQAPAPPPAPAFRVVGFVLGDLPLVILEDSEGSYIVGPGETVKPGVRVLGIDVRRELVRIEQNGTAFDLMITRTGGR